LYRHFPIYGVRESLRVDEREVVSICRIDRDSASRELSLKHGDSFTIITAWHREWDPNVAEYDFVVRPVGRKGGQLRLCGGTEARNYGWGELFPTEIVGTGISQDAGMVLLVLLYGGCIEGLIGQFNFGLDSNLVYMSPEEVILLSVQITCSGSLPSAVGDGMRTCMFCPTPGRTAMTGIPNDFKVATGPIPDTMRS